MLLDEQTVPKYRFNVVEKVIKKMTTITTAVPAAKTIMVTIMMMIKIK